MTPARKSPSTRTLGSQLVAISTVLALIDRMFFTASRPMPVMATSRKAMTVMIFARIEKLSNMKEDPEFRCRRAPMRPPRQKPGGEIIRETTAQHSPERLIGEPVQLRRAGDNWYEIRRHLQV